MKVFCKNHKTTMNLWAVAVLIIVLFKEKLCADIESIHNFASAAELKCCDTIIDFQDALHSFNHDRAALLISCVQDSFNALAEKKTYHFKGECSVFVFGSSANDISLPCSDLEFGIIGDELFLMQRSLINDFLGTLKTKLGDYGIHFDHNGWIPYFTYQGSAYGHAELIGTPQQLIANMYQSSLVTLRYALNMTKFIFGNRALYDEFRMYKNREVVQQRRMIMQEYCRTVKRISLIRALSEHVDYLLKKRSKKHAFIAFNHKPHLVKPIIELLNYMSFYSSIPFGNPFEQVNQLVEKKILSADVAQQIELALIWGLRKRCELGGQDCLFESCTGEILELVQEHWKTLFNLERCVSKLVC